MGCDIHSVGQVCKGNKWKTVRQDVGGDERNYDTFAMLADVRNGSGFAGCDTGDGFIPISTPRDLPKDLGVVDGETLPIPAGTPSGNDWSWVSTDAMKKYAEAELEKTSVWLGDHSYSWLLLSEMKAYLEKYAQLKTVKRGFVPEAEYLEIRKTGAMPNSWCGGVGGGNTVSLSEEGYKQLEKLNDLPKEKEIYVQYSWSVSYGECGNLRKIIAELEQISAEHSVGPEQVRFVFGFDS